VVDFLHALDFRRVVGEVLVDLEVELEPAALVHTLVRVDGELKVEDIVGVREVRLHRRAEGQLFEICSRISFAREVVGSKTLRYLSVCEVGLGSPSSSCSMRQQQPHLVAAASSVTGISIPTYLQAPLKRH
jgi:hypothetical protein